MATEIMAGPYGEVRAASTAGGGTALTSTAARIVLPHGAKYMALIPRNFSSANVVKWNKNPYLTVLKTTDLLVTTTNLTDYSSAAQDNDTATDVVLSSLPTLASGGSLYIGSRLPFSGLEVDVDSTNGTASVLSGTYRKSDGTWANISLTDGTASGGATFAIDGNITWTVPTDWITTRLKDAVAGTPANLGLLNEEFFWVRLVVSVALDSSTTLNSMIAINRSTAYAELVSGLAWEESITVGPGGIYSITALTDAGTANLIVNTATRQNGAF